MINKCIELTDSVSEISSDSVTGRLSEILDILGRELMRNPADFFNISPLFLEMALTKRFVIYENNVLKLLPVIPKSPLLFHKGSIKYGSSDNLDQMEMKGIFGNSDMHSPTYVSTTGNVLTNYYDFNHKPDIILTIDRDLLLDRRRIFIDPESITSNINFGSEFEKTFFVLGGIPVEAITSYELLQ